MKNASMRNTTASRNVVIVAPHVDDELIGCWSYLRDGLVSTVIYLEELSPERRAEALACANTYGFEAVFDCAEFTPVLEKLLLVPSITDTHPAHRRANLEWRKCCHNVKFYSVDLNQPTKQALPDWQDKKAALDRLFPSQQALWATNANYYLFEDVQDTDYRVLGKIQDVFVSGCGMCKVRTSSPNDLHTNYESIKHLIDSVSGFYFSIETKQGLVYESRH